jgi:Arc/MetJ-type ribon-helix-helix transcriptional regulator
MMALTVRLNPKAERALNALAKRRRLSRSEVVREAIARYDASEQGADDSGRPYDAWLDVLGIVNLGARDPGRTTGDQFATIVKKQVRARRAR